MVCGGLITLYIDVVYIGTLIQSGFYLNRTELSKRGSSFILLPLFFCLIVALTMIKGILIVNNYGKPRLVKFYQSVVSSVGEIRTFNLALSFNYALFISLDE